MFRSQETMVLNLDELVLKPWEQLSEEETGVVVAVYDALAIRREIERKGIRLIFGLWQGQQEKEQTKKEQDGEIESFTKGEYAFVVALKYLTNGRTIPLREEQYVRFQKFVIDHFPRAIWAEEMWFKRFNKIVERYDIPVDENVALYMGQNECLNLEYLFAGSPFGTGDKKKDRETYVGTTFVSLVIEGDHLSIVRREVSRPLHITRGDARKLYELLTGNLDHSQLH